MGFISNNREGFETLFQRIESVSDDLTNVKVGLEATGYYSYNLLEFLLDKGLSTYVINPLHTNLYRKSLSLRKTKTDKVDSRTLATMIAFSDTPKGASASVSVYSIIETAKANGLNVYTYLEYLLLYMPDHDWQISPEDLDDLMPWPETVCFPVYLCSRI